MTALDTSCWHSVGAFRGCDAHDRHCGISYTAVTEAHGPDVVAAILAAAADRAGTLCPPIAPDGHREHDDCYATLDIRDEDGLILSDRCIPTCEAFTWWVRAVELRVDSSDCPVDTPEAHAATYAAIDLWQAGRREDAIAAFVDMVHGGAR